MPPRLDFRVEATASGSRARAARFTTLHNEVLTPTFMPVGTHGAVRAQRREDVLASGAQVLLANTYHLMLRPGTELLEKFGGIHRFMNWPRSVLTDSGGYQIFSLPGNRSISEGGAEFKSYVDQTTLRLSPETSIAAQRMIGSDIMMVLDHCVPSTVEREVAREAMELTHRWALRSLAARGESPQALFGIVQGAQYADLRAASAQTIAQMPFDGYAIGGLAVGEGAAEREACTAIVTELLPSAKPRYLMGVGTTRDLLEAVHRGVDMFDCILPTALAKQGVAFTSLGRRDLRRAAYREREGPLDPACGCDTCRNYSIAYLLHLNRVREPQGWQLVGLHNIHFYMQLMRRMREHILADTWADFYRSQRDVLDVRDSYGRAPTHVTKAQRRKLKLSLGRYEVLVRDGVGRIRDTASGEVMHSVTDPMEEARSLYVEQSHLAARLLGPGPAGGLVVWDVGLGAGANAMAAIEAAEGLHWALVEHGIPEGRATAAQGGAGALAAHEIAKARASGAQGGGGARAAHGIVQAGASAALPHEVARARATRQGGAEAGAVAQEGEEAGSAAPDGATSREVAARGRRQLVLVSFENDVDSLVLALRHPAWFKHLRRAAPHRLLADDRWECAAAKVEWRLIRGDFCATKFAAPPPDLVFFDPFSFKTNGALWTLQAFRELADLWTGKAVELYTYSHSTCVRAAMLAAGLYVAKGRATGPKAETTIGLTPGAAALPHGHELLGAQWLSKWRRSEAQAPLGADAGDGWRAALLSHPQFRGGG